MQVVPVVVVMGVREAAGLCVGRWGQEGIMKGKDKE